MRTAEMLIVVTALISVIACVYVMLKARSKARLFNQLDEAARHFAERYGVQRHVFTREAVTMVNLMRADAGKPFLSVVGFEGAINAAPGCSRHVEITIREWMIYFVLYNAVSDLGVSLTADIGHGFIVHHDSQVTTAYRIEESE